jgi:catechol 2,3-dioxygenase-like lactoylglutathione lyase family enzyme
LLFVAGAATAQAGAPPTTDPLLGSGRGLDHVLLWTREPDRETATLSVKLGFQIRQGGDFGNGIANRLINFADQTYLELLFFTRPGSELEGGTLDVWRFTERGPGANNFASEVSDIEATGAHLRSRGWTIGPESPATFDPDGDGPRQPEPNLYRIAYFPTPPLGSSDLFFIRYRPVARTPQQQADRDEFVRHPNGARRISAVWLLSANAAEEAERLRRIGFAEDGPVELPQVGARGRRFAAGRGSVLVVEPSGPGQAAEALAARGPHFFAISVATVDLDRAQRLVQRGYGGTVETYAGLFGQSFIAPTQSDLGLRIEFHTGQAN